MGTAAFCCPAVSVSLAAIPTEERDERMPKENRPNMNYAGNMDVDAWRSRQISKRLKAKISAQTQEFIRQHGSDTDEQLREYVHRKATLLHRMPHPLELPGGDYLVSRLGDWDQLAREFGVMPVSRARGRMIYKRLRNQEAESFLQERRTRKEEKRQRAWQQDVNSQTERR